MPLSAQLPLLSLMEWIGAKVPFLSWPVNGEVLSGLGKDCCGLNLPNNLSYSEVTLTQ